MYTKQKLPTTVSSCIFNKCLNTYHSLFTLHICEAQTKNNDNIFESTLCSIKYYMKEKCSYSIFNIK